MSLPGMPVPAMLKNAVRSLTRLACCMLWVTMTMVYFSLSSSMRSSIASVEIGSKAEQGSSIRMISGSTAIVRAIHNRCCCPPEIPEPGLSRRSLTSSHRFAPRRDFSTKSSASDFEMRRLLSLTPAITLSLIDMVGKGLGRWNTMPIWRLTITGSTPGA